MLADQINFKNCDRNFYLCPTTKPSTMKKIIFLLFVFINLQFLISCEEKKQTNITEKVEVTNSIKHAKGFEIYEYDVFSVLKVTNPWPKAEKTFTYVLHKKDAEIPEKFKKYTQVEIPIKSMVATSTTHIPSLEMLQSENLLVGFPGTNYISSEKTRSLIDLKKIKEVGSNQSLNTELIIDLQPDVLVGFSIDDQNKTYQNLEKSGIKILYNGDWTEQTPLGKAEWIKFFGALLDKSEEAENVFGKIVSDYEEIRQNAQKSNAKPTILSGAIYQEQWYLPGGKSWASIFLKDANATYLWEENQEVGSLSLSFENVLEKAKNADFWIGPAEFTSLAEMVQANPNYGFFKSFQNKKVYSFSSKKGKTGGILYYELASNRPDLVLKDLVSILHPEMYPNHQLYFFEKLK